MLDVVGNGKNSLMMYISVKWIPCFYEFQAMVNHCMDEEQMQCVPLQQNIRNNHVINHVSETQTGEGNQTFFPNREFKIYSTYLSAFVAYVHTKKYYHLKSLFPKTFLSIIVRN